MYKDNCSSDYSDLKLAFVVKNEYLVDDNNDLEGLEISDCESDKNIKSNNSIDSESEKSNSKTEKPDEKLKGKNDEIHYLVKSHSEIPKITIPSLEPSTLICPVCKEEFNSHAFLLQHYPNHYPSYLCDICGQAYLNKSSLLRHVAIHTLKRYPCKLCQKSYANSSALNQHVKRTHEGRESYACQLCPKRFSSYSARNKHRTEDHGIPARTYVCPSCGKIFLRSSRLSVHIRRDHHKIKNFECTVCDNKFFTKSELKDHVLKHTGKLMSVCVVSYAFL